MPDNCLWKVLNQISPLQFHSQSHAPNLDIFKTNCSVALSAASMKTSMMLLASKAARNWCPAPWFCFMNWVDTVSFGLEFFDEYVF
ncbi:hypothetical protein Nepgr_029165 [Nepenthes gracilis]|uniref:Uncharacterized protein n=1 Tax=Nepenthes gracilis TaxID=150966 RepID=A0AAD3TDG9_NEPGR|nr:hypothetical protein Nepgr_029165 [Nepenthes gracilis]